jgi:hypothetical protein
MGTWSDGLWDNDSALDELWLLVKIDGEEPDAARLAVRIGLLAWLNPISIQSDEGHLGAMVDAAAAGREHLPGETREALRELLAHREAVMERHSRTPEVHAAMGGYSDGPRIDALLRFPGAQPVIDELAEACAGMLDVLLRPGKSLYEIAGGLASLGVLIELTQAGLHRPTPARVARWRAGLTAIDKATREERSFWWKYIRRVRLGFDLLVPRPAAAGSAV